MKLARVHSTVVSTIQHPSFDHHRLLLCDYLDEHGAPTGRYVIAVDAGFAGAGGAETVLILDEGNGARQVLGDPDAPIRAVVVGVVDAVELG